LGSRRFFAHAKEVVEPSNLPQDEVVDAQHAQLQGHQGSQAGLPAGHQGEMNTPQ